jgi:hypothetical protein
MASIDKIPLLKKKNHFKFNTIWEKYHKYVISSRYVSTSFKKLQEVVKLAMYISTNLN